jgi:hypothetical protein
MRNGQDGQDKQDSKMGENALTENMAVQPRMIMDWHGYRGTGEREGISPEVFCARTGFIRVHRCLSVVLRFNNPIQVHPVNPVHPV